MATPVLDPRATRAAFGRVATRVTLACALVAAAGCGGGSTPTVAQRPTPPAPPTEDLTIDMTTVTLEATLFVPEGLPPPAVPVVRPARRTTLDKQRAAWKKIAADGKAPLARKATEAQVLATLLLDRARALPAEAPQRATLVAEARTALAAVVTAAAGKADRATLEMAAAIALGAGDPAIDLAVKSPRLLEDLDGARVKRINILAYEPAFGIIGNPAKMDPRTRQSADHSMAYIVATLLRKALEHADRARKTGDAPLPRGGGSNDAVWKALMLAPADYSHAAIFNKRTRALMQKITFEHGGPKYDKAYPDGIPTSLKITDDQGKVHDSGFVMYPGGHARNTTADLEDLLAHKFRLLGGLASRDVDGMVKRLSGVGAKSARELAEMNDFRIEMGEKVD